MSQVDISRYLSGDALYGDDFNAEQIAAWFEAEAEGYADLGARDAANYRYEYHAWNILHGFRHLPSGRFERVLGFGSAYGEEVTPVIARVGALDVVDASGAFARDQLHGVPVRFTRADASGKLPFDDNVFSLVTCFGVLHHIPNVSFVVGELARVLAPGGHLIVREPIVSMGDWRVPRVGLTKNERGIPLRLLRAIVANTGLTTAHESICGFGPLERIYRPLRKDMYNSTAFSRADALVSAIFAWNLRYHARRFFDLFRPSSAFFVMRKPALSGTV